MNSFYMLGASGYAFLDNIASFISMVKIPVTIALLVGAAFLVIGISVALARAETGEKANEMKRRLWQLIFTIFIIILLFWLLDLVLANIDSIIKKSRG